MEGKTALVLGASGGIGSEVAAKLLLAGWQVRALHRAPGQGNPRVEWLKGDALVAGDVAAAAAGASHIVHAVNPPLYRDWDKLVLPMLDNTIAAAQASRARIVLPGTVYNFGPETFPDLAEDAPQNPRTRKGHIRVEMERRLEQAVAEGRAKALIVRAGDFFGPKTGNSWFSQGLVRPGSRPKAIIYPGRRGVGHQWAYLPDVAETMVRLVESGRLADFDRFHMEGHWDPDGGQVADAIVRVLGEPAVRVRRMPWPLMRLAAPFVPLVRELAEMRYLWEQPVRLRNKKLMAALGYEPRTDLDQALRTSLAGMGCL